MNAPDKSNWLTMLVAIGSLGIQVSWSVFWGGKVSQRLDEHDRRLAEQALMIGHNDQKLSEQTVTTAIIGTQLIDIKDTVQNIERKVDAIARKP